MNINTIMVIASAGTAVGVLLVLGFLALRKVGKLLDSTDYHEVDRRNEKQGKPCPNCKENVPHCACKRNICIRCGGPVGNVIFSVCVKCWDSL